VQTISLDEQRHSELHQITKECQLFKQQRKHYRKLHKMLYDLNPWSQIYVDHIGPWSIKTPKQPQSLYEICETRPSNVMVIRHPSIQGKRKEFAVAFDQQWLGNNLNHPQCIH